jgi:predicted ATPase with chaperone activity
LPDSAVRESRERVRTAIRNAGFAFPPDRITVNLAPVDLRKEGASFDLPIDLTLARADGTYIRLLAKLARLDRVGGGRRENGKNASLRRSPKPFMNIAKYTGAPRI